MYVNPFWMGVLVTLVVEIIIVLITAFVMTGAKKEEDDE